MAVGVVEVEVAEVVVAVVSPIVEVPTPTPILHPTTIKIILPINNKVRNPTRRVPDTAQMFPTTRVLVTGRKAVLRPIAVTPLSAAG